MEENFESLEAERVKQQAEINAAEPLTEEEAEEREKLSQQVVTTLNCRDLKTGPSAISFCLLKDANGSAGIN